MIAPSEHLENRIEELETEVQQLKAELRQYQPSDGMMVKLLGLNVAIQEAARLFERAMGDDEPAQVSTVSPATWAAIEAWLRLPVVNRAVKSALAQAVVKEKP